MVDRRMSLVDHLDPVDRLLAERQAQGFADVPSPAAVQAIGRVLRRIEDRLKPRRVGL